MREGLRLKGWEAQGALGSRLGGWEAIRLRGDKACAFIGLGSSECARRQGDLSVLFFRKCPDHTGLFLSANNMIKFRQVNLQHIGRRA
jgi:hypothetical protein